MSSSTIINIPADEKAFESNCVALFAGLLNDPNVKLVGTRGKKQYGLDLIGRRDRNAAQPVGIQCKLITRGGKLSEKTVREEVAQALTIQPPLTEFYIVTTATDEPALDFLAISLSQQQAKIGREIDIQVWGWDTLQEKIRANPHALNAFDPDYSASTNKLIELGIESAEKQSVIVGQNDRIIETVEAIRTVVAIGPIDTQRSAAFEVHLDTQVDHYRDLMNAGQPRTALGLLERLEARLQTGSSIAIRARVKANIAFAKMRLGHDAEGAALLGEAYELNPTDPKTRANKILSLALLGDHAAAWSLAEEVLTEDSQNAGAAAMAFQVAATASTQFDPLEIVPHELLDDLHVRVQRISFLRHKGLPEWRDLAAETYTKFPDDGIALRMAGDALIDAGLADHILEKSGVLPEDRREMLVEGAALLQRHWNEVRLYENAAEPSWIIVGLNLTTSYRALGDQVRAQEICAQMLALKSSEPDCHLVAAQVALDQDHYDDAISILKSAPAGTATTLPLMVAHANLNDWQAVWQIATPQAREAVSPADKQMFDVMRFRARRIAEHSFDLDNAVEELLSAWPLGVAAHTAVADIYRRDKPEALSTMAAKAKSLITADTRYADRVMFAQLALFRHEWDDIIAVLDGHVPVDRASEPLEWLGYAFANGITRPRTARFFKTLAPDVIASSRYARIAGAAEHNRGDLDAAETYLRTAIAGDPKDLRAYLLLGSTLESRNRLVEAVELLRGIDDASVEGSPLDRMRLAHTHRRNGDTTRALHLGYQVAAAHRDREDLMASYPGLIFRDEALPDPVGRAGPGQENFWFDLEGLEGTRDVAGVIDAQTIGGVDTFAPSHALAAAVMGKNVGDVVVMPAELGEDRRYRVRALKHKYIWLLHDIMASHAARFPAATSLVEMTMKEGDIQPVLEMARGLQERGDIATQTYQDFPVPLAAIAASADRSVIALAEQLSRSGINLRTCLGANDEREEAAGFVRSARAKGIVLDTLTLWQLRDLGHLTDAKAYFGRLCIAQSTFDEFLELRAKIDANRGREYMTLGFEGDQAFRQIHSVEETEARLVAINAAINDFERHCEILPVEGSDDVRYGNLLGQAAVADIFDPIWLARDQGLILVSEDLNLRQYAASQQVTGGAWLQVVLNVMAADGAIPTREYLIAIGKLGVMRHDHLWLDAGAMIGILTLDHEHSFALFEAAIQFIGGAKAEMQSHLSVASDFMRGIWGTTLPDWEKGRAIGRLLTQLVNSRGHEWQAILHILDTDLGIRARGRDLFAQYAQDYLVGWIEGHFFNLEDIRSAENVAAGLQNRRPIKRAKKVAEKRNRRSQNKNG